MHVLKQNRITRSYILTVLPVRNYISSMYLFKESRETTAQADRQGLDEDVNK